MEKVCVFFLAHALLDSGQIPNTNISLGNFS